MRAAQLPGMPYLEEFQETIEGILEMPADDCVKTLAGEGKSYQEARARAQRLHDLLTPQNLQLLRAARRSRDVQYPTLKAHEPSDEITKADDELHAALASEQFYEYLDVIRRATELLRTRYQAVYAQFHQQRLEAYTTAIDEIKGLPEWAQVATWVTSTEDPIIQEERKLRLDAVLSRLADKICETPVLSDETDTCGNCRATIAQMESESAAVDTLKSHAIRVLQELATPEKKIVRVRLASVLGSVVETPEDVEQAVERLKEHLLKLLAEDTRLVLE
jgi:hypothetical protein